MDFRFKYRRHPDSPEEQLRERHAKRQERDNSKRMRGLGFGLAIPFSLASGPIGGWLLGQWLDQHFGTSFLMLTLILLGTAAGMKMSIDLLSKLNRDD